MHDEDVLLMIAWNDKHLMSSSSKILFFERILLVVSSLFYTHFSIIDENFHVIDNIAPLQSNPTHHQLLQI